MRLAERLRDNLRVAVQALASAPVLGASALLEVLLGHGCLLHARRRTAAQYVDQSQPGSRSYSNAVVNHGSSGASSPNSER